MEFILTLQAKQHQTEDVRQDGPCGPIQHRWHKQNC